MSFWGTVGNALFGSRTDNEYSGVDRSQFDVPGFQQSLQQYGGMADQFGNRRGVNPSAESGFRPQQAGLIRQLQADAMGQGPGQQLVRMQAQEMADRGARQQMAMAAGARPGMGGMAARNAAFNAGNMQSAVGGQAAQGGLQARLGAMSQLGGVLQGARGQDLQNNQFNSDLALRQMGLNDQSQLEALRQRLQLQGMQQAGGMGYEQQRTGRFGTAAGVPTGQEQTMGFLGGLLGTAATAFGKPG